MQQISRRITLCHGCSPVNLLHIIRTPFTKNTSERLLLHTVPLFKVSTNIKSFDKTALENYKFLKGLLPPAFSSWFKFSFESHSHDTRLSNVGCLKTRSYRTKTYGRYSVFVNIIYVWNDLQSCHQNVILHKLRANKLKEILITFSPNSCN